MKSKMSFFNAGIVKQDFKQHGWIGIVYLIGLLFVLPLQILMMSPDLQSYYENLSDVIWINYDLQWFFLFTIPVFAGIILFRYLQSKDAADMMHSLPVQRKTLYVNHIFSGLLMLLPPIWITTISTWIVCRVQHFSFQLTTVELLSWTGIMTLLTIFLFIFSVTVGMITGMSTAQGILTYIFLLLPVGLLMLVNIQLRLFLYGYPDTYIINEKLKMLSPLTRFLNIKIEPFTANEAVIYTLLIFLFFIVGYLLYKHRHLENATSTIAFHLLKPVFKYGVTLSVMLLFGSYFNSSQNGQMGWIAFGFISGAIAGYIIAETILQKTWRIFNPRLLIGFAGYAVVIAMLFLGIRVDVIGYQTKVPDMNQIQSVFFGQNIFEIKTKEWQHNLAVNSGDASYITAVRLLHEQIIAKRTENENSSIDSKGSIAIAYQLKNGNIMMREYRIPYELVENELKPVMEAEIYKQQVYHLYQLDKPIEKITFQPSESVDKRLVILDPAEIAELKEILKQEILSSSYEEMNDPRASWSTIEISFIPTDEELEAMRREAGHAMVSLAMYVRHYEWKKSYQNIERWLEEKEYLSQSRILPKEIDYIEILKANEDDSSSVPEIAFEQQIGEIVKIEDEDIIKEALGQYSRWNSSRYYVRFTTVKGEQFYGKFVEGNEPAFLSRFF